MTARGWDCPQCRRAERWRKVRAVLHVLTLTVVGVVLLGALIALVGWFATGEWWWL